MDLIYLNGPSSAGKTSIARTLQDVLNEPYLYLGVDMLLDMMPARTNRWDGVFEAEGFSWRPTVLPDGSTGMQVVGGEYGRSVEALFRDLAASCVATGHRLIIDNADSAAELSRWQARFADAATCFVGVHCPLETLRQREAVRPDRMPGSAAEQYFRVHLDCVYDITVNTDHDSVKDCAERIAAFVPSAVTN